MSDICDTRAEFLYRKSELKQVHCASVENKTEKTTKKNRKKIHSSFGQPKYLYHFGRTFCFILIWNFQRRITAIASAFNQIDSFSFFQLLPRPFNIISTQFCFRIVCLLVAAIPHAASVSMSIDLTNVNLNTCCLWLIEYDHKMYSFAFFSFSFLLFLFSSLIWIARNANTSFCIRYVFA